MTGETAHGERAGLAAQVIADDAGDAAAGRGDGDAHGNRHALGDDQRPSAGRGRHVGGEHGLRPLRGAQRQVLRERRRANEKRCAADRGRAEHVCHPALETVVSRAHPRAPEGAAEA